MGTADGGCSVNDLRDATPSTPRSEKLNPVAHASGAHACPDAQDTAQLLTDRVALLRSQNHPGVFAAGIDPFRMEPKEIGDVEAVEDASVFAGVGQMLILGLCHQAGIRSRGHCHVATAKSGNEAAVYSVLVDIDLERLQRGSG